MKFGNIIRVETSRYLMKITTLRDREGFCSQAYGFATITMYSWWWFGEPAYHSEIIFCQGGEAGRAHHCMRCICTNSAWSKAKRGPKLNLKFGPCWTFGPRRVFCGPRRTVSPLGAGGAVDILEYVCGWLKTWFPGWPTISRASNTSANVARY